MDIVKGIKNEILPTTDAIDIVHTLVLVQVVSSFIAAALGLTILAVWLCKDCCEKCIKRRDDDRLREALLE